MSTTALTAADRSLVRRKRPNRPSVDNAFCQFVVSALRGPVQRFTGATSLLKNAPLCIKYLRYANPRFQSKSAAS